LRLFCFSFAGGGASVYRRWCEFVPPAVDIAAVQLPGRETRFRDAPITRLEPLVDELTRELRPYWDVPFVLFGHSMGALVSFELARRIRRESIPHLAALFVASRRAPQIGRLETDEPPMYTLSDEAFKDRVRRFNGTPAAILENAELLNLLMPMFRADFTVVETYAYRDEPPLSVPITAFGGVYDGGVTREQLQAWEKQTSSTFQLHVFPGGHFFMQTDAETFFPILKEELQPFLRSSG
jgi:medium-chain acyl-[acyl-carrier-protein] hydrolase